MWMEQYGGGGSSWGMGSSNPSTPSSNQQRQAAQSLTSHFHLSHLVEKLAESAENGGVRDHQSDALVAELTNQFDKCQQLLNSISASIQSRSTTVEGQKHKLEESEQLLTHTRDVISKHTKSVQDLINPPL